MGNSIIYLEVIMSNIIYQNRAESFFNFKKEWVKEKGFKKFLDGEKGVQVKKSKGKTFISFGEDEILHFILSDFEKYFISEDNKPLEKISCSNILIPFSVLPVFADFHSDLIRVLDPNKPVFWDVERKGKKEFKPILAKDLCFPLGFELKKLESEKNPSLPVKISKKRYKDISIMDLYVPLTSFLNGRYFFHYFVEKNIRGIYSYLIARGAFPMAMSVVPYRDYYIPNKGFEQLVAIFWYIFRVRSTRYDEPSDCRIEIFAAVDDYYEEANDNSIEE